MKRLALSAAFWLAVQATPSLVQGECLQTGKFDRDTSGVKLAVHLAWIPTADELANIKAAFANANVALCDASDRALRIAEVTFELTPPEAALLDAHGAIPAGGANARADVRIYPHAGRAFRAGGELGAGGYVVLYYDTNFVHYENGALSPTRSGQTIAHELAHFLLGVGDSYAEANIAGVGGCAMGHSFEPPGSPFDAYPEDLAANNSLMQSNEVGYYCGPDPQQPAQLILSAYPDVELASHLEPSTTFGPGTNTCKYRGSDRNWTDGTLPSSGAGLHLAASELSSDWNFDRVTGDRITASDHPYFGRAPRRSSIQKNQPHYLLVPQLFAPSSDLQAPLPSWATFSDFAYGLGVLGSAPAQIISFPSPVAANHNDPELANLTLAIRLFRTTPTEVLAIIATRGGYFEGRNDEEYVELGRFRLEYSPFTPASPQFRRPIAIDGVSMYELLAASWDGATPGPLTITLGSSCGAPFCHGPGLWTLPLRGDASATPVTLWVGLEEILLGPTNSLIPTGLALRKVESTIQRRLWDATSRRWVGPGVYARYPNGVDAPPVNVFTADGLLDRPELQYERSPAFLERGSAWKVDEDGSLLYRAEDCTVPYYLRGFNLTTREFEETGHRLSNGYAPAATPGEVSYVPLQQLSERRSARLYLEKTLCSDLFRRTNGLVAANPSDAQCAERPDCASSGDWFKDEKSCVPPVRFMGKANIAAWDAIRPDQLLLLLDRSGSMEETYLEYSRLDHAKAAARMLVAMEKSRVTALTTAAPGTTVPGTLLGVSSFSSGELVEPSTTLVDVGTDLSRPKDYAPGWFGAVPAPASEVFNWKIGELTPQGRTEMGEALQNALETFRNTPASSASPDVKAVFLLTDGLNNGSLDPHEVIAQLEAEDVAVYPILFNEADLGLGAELANRTGGSLNAVQFMDEQPGAFLETYAMAHGAPIYVPRTRIGLAAAEPDMVFDAWSDFPTQRGMPVRHLSVASTVWKRSVRLDQHLARVSVVVNRSAGTAPLALVARLGPQGSMVAPSQHVRDGLFDLFVFDYPADGTAELEIKNRSTGHEFRGLVTVIGERMDVGPLCKSGLSRSTIHDGESVDVHPVTGEELPVFQGAEFTTRLMSPWSTPYATIPTQSPVGLTHDEVGELKAEELPGRGLYLIETECSYDQSARMHPGEALDPRERHLIRPGKPVDEPFHAIARTALYYDTTRLPPLAAVDAAPGGDADDDGVTNEIEGFVADSDGDGLPDYRDTDSDSDDVPDRWDPRRTIPDGECGARPAPLACCMNALDCGSFSGYALYAGHFLALRDRSRVVAANSPLGRVAVAGLTEDELDSSAPPVFQLGRSAEVGRVEAGGNAFFQNESHVTDSLLLAGTLEKQTGVILDGRVETGADLTFPELTYPPVTAPAVPDSRRWLAVLEPDQTRSLTTGSYGPLLVKSRAQLTLGPGSYYFESFSLEPGAQLIVENANQPVKLYIKDSFFLRGTVSQKSATNQLLFVYFGAQQAPVEVPLHATLLAPNARVTLAAGVEHQGSVVADTIELGPDATFRQDPFLGSWRPDPIPDISSCAVSAVGPGRARGGVPWGAALLAAATLMTRRTFRGRKRAR